MIKKASAILFILTFFHLKSQCQDKQIIVSINRNIEVINAITIPLNPDMLQDSVKDSWMFNNTQLMRLANDYFKPYGKHNSINLAQSLLDKLGTGIYLLALYYDELPLVNRKSEIPEIIWSEVSKNKDSAYAVFDNFMMAASDFYKVSHFRKFQNKCQPVYVKALQQVRMNLPEKNFIPTLEKYYGDTKAGYNIVLMPFFKSKWGMGWETSENGKKNIYNITSPFNEQVVFKNKVVQVGFDNSNEITNLSIHEFGHSFVNTLTSTEPFLSEIKKFDSLFRPIKNYPQYSDWITLFNEHIVRAGEIIVMNQLGNFEFAEKTKKSYSDWTYLNHFLAELTIYANNRDRYPTFKDFLPKLIESLSLLK
jgi:hypothetical protein